MQPAEVNALLGYRCGGWRPLIAMVGTNGQGGQKDEVSMAIRTVVTD